MPRGNGWKELGQPDIYSRYLKIYWGNHGNQKLKQLIFYGHLIRDSLSRTPPGDLATHKPKIDMWQCIGVNTQSVPTELNRAGGIIRKYAQLNWIDTSIYQFNHDIYNAKYIFDIYSRKASKKIYRFPDSTSVVRIDTGFTNAIYANLKWARANHITYYQSFVNIPGWFTKHGYAKPIDPVRHPGRDSTVAESYDRISRIFYLYTAIFGNGNVTDNKIKNQILYPDSINYGVLEYIEPGNEMDKGWAGPAQNYTAQALVAYCSAVYDGNAGTMGRGLGIKTADKKVKVIEPALVYGIYNRDYSKAMYYYSHYFRRDHRAMPFDIFNFHYYSSNGTIGISPERDSLRSKIDSLATILHTIDPKMEIWWTEFGYDRTSSRGSSQAVPNHIGSLDSLTLQAAWLIRDFLAGSGIVDRMVMYEIRNETNDDAPNAGRYATSGLTKFQFMDGSRNIFNCYAYPQYWYMQTFRNILRNYMFDRTIRNHAGDSVWMYKFKNIDNDSVAYVVWCPTEVDKKVNSLSLEIGRRNTAIEIIKFADKRAFGKSTLETIGVTGKAKLQINEVPQIILTTNSTTGGRLINTN